MLPPPVCRVDPSASRSWGGCRQQLRVAQRRVPSITTHRSAPHTLIRSPHTDPLPTHRSAPPTLIRSPHTDPCPQEALVTLVSTGSAICGCSAVAATQPIINAEAHEVAAAVGVVVLCGTLAMFIYPAL